MTDYLKFNNRKKIVIQWVRARGQDSLTAQDEKLDRCAEKFPGGG
jgi:hypothetical protein